MNLLSESFLCGSFDSGPDMSRLGAAGLLSLGDSNPAACLEDTMFLQRQVGGGIFGCDAFLGILDGKGLCLGLCSESTMAFRTQNVPTTPLWIGPSRELWRISHDSWPILTNLTVVSNFQFIRARFVLVEAACSKQMPQLLEGNWLARLAILPGLMFSAMKRLTSRDTRCSAGSAWYRLQPSLPPSFVPIPDWSSMNTPADWCP